MKLVRYEYKGEILHGRVEGDSVRPLAGAPWESTEAAGPAAPLSGVRLLAPTAPGKVIAIGLNYKDHAAEFNKELPTIPMLFTKAITSVIGPGQAIEVPPDVGRVDHEAELGVVIGRTCRRVSPARAMDHVLGLTCLNDVSARRFQKTDIQYTRAKGFDTFCPLGPWIVTGLDPADLAVRAEVNGRLAQDSRTSQLVFPVPELVSFVSRVMTLMPGDVIATGTPSGVGPLNPGDKVTIEIEGIGRLTNPVIAGQPFELED